MFIKHFILYKVYYQKHSIKISLIFTCKIQSIRFNVDAIMVLLSNSKLLSRSQKIKNLKSFKANNVTLLEAGPRNMERGNFM